MNSRHLGTGVLMIAGAVACGGAPDVEDELSDETIVSHALAGSSDLARTFGAGTYAIGDLEVKFALGAIEHHNGSASGLFRHRTSYDGLIADFTGAVTCLAVDSANHRAWIGGVVVSNRSTDPDYAAEIFQPGHDVWFRVVDYDGAEPAVPDRTTFLGFEGGGGIITSAEYCEKRIWPDADARTWPVTKGQIVVRP